MRTYLIADKPELKQRLFNKWQSDLYSNTAILAKEEGLPTSAVYSFLYDSGCKMKNVSEVKKKYNLDESFFDIIDTEEKAYFLGFLYADGYNSEKYKAFRLVLQKRDDVILHKFNTMLKSNRPISYVKKGGNRQDTATLVVVNKYMSDRLVLLGCMQAKTYKVTYPKWMSENLHRHFIRGVFDGDGCLSGASFSIMGTKDLLDNIQAIMIKQLGLSKTKFISRPNKIGGFNYVLRYNGYGNQISIYNWFYKDSTVFLERKKKKFEDYLIPHNTQTRKWGKIEEFIKI